jgi:AcrR family transcriptional regulator
MAAEDAPPLEEHRHPGRPRSATAEEAILRATIELIAEGGLGAATIQAVSDRSGVARATIYLRWPSRERLLEAAMRHAIGREPYALSGDIEEDIRRGLRQALAVFSEPLFVAVLPVLIAAFIRGGAAPEGLSFDMLFPGRRRLADEYREHAAEQGWRTDIDAEVVFALLAGAPLIELLATGSVPSAERAEEMLDVFMAGLRRPVRAPASAM